MKEFDRARERRAALSARLARELQRDGNGCEACADPIFDDQAVFAVESDHVLCVCCARCASYPLDRVTSVASVVDVAVWLVRPGRCAGRATAQELGSGDGKGRGEAP